MDLIPTPEQLATPPPTCSTWSFRGGLADLRRTPARDHRRGAASAPSTATSPRDDDAGSATLPVLLVPPLAAPTRLLRPAPRLLAGRAPARARATRPTSSSTATIALLRPRPRPRALGRRRDADARSARVSEDAGGAPGAARRLVPGRDHVAARAGRRRRRCRSRRSRWSPARSTSRRCGSIAPMRPVAEPHQRLRSARALPRARRRARAARQARASSSTSLDKYLTKPLAIADAPRRPRLPRADRGGRPLHGPACTPTPGARSASSTTASSASTTSPTGALELGDATAIDLADVRVPVLAVAGAGDVLAPRPAVHHVGDAAAQRARGARSRPRPAATSACSRAARARAHDVGLRSTTSSPTPRAWPRGAPRAVARAA